MSADRHYSRYLRAKAKTLFTFVALVCSSAPSVAYTGNEFLAHLTGDATDRVYAIGYVQALGNMMAFFPVAEQCVDFPEGVDGAQLMDVIEKYLKENPEERHLHATTLAFGAFSEAFGVVPPSQNFFC